MTDVNVSEVKSTESVSELNERIELPPEVWQQINHDAQLDLVSHLVTQLIVVVLILLGSLFFASFYVSLYAVLGGFAYLIPNLMLGAIVWYGVKCGKNTSSIVLLGVFLKILLVALILWLIVAVSGNKIVWPALIVGFIITIKSHFFMLVIKKY